MDITPFDYVMYYIHEVVHFFSNMYLMFPPLIMEFLFFIPAMWFVFLIIRAFKSEFGG